MPTNTTEEKKTKETPSSLTEGLLSVGAHYGYSKARRHPSTGKYVYGIKNGIEVFDIEKSAEALEEALSYVKSLGEEGKTLVLVGTKNEAKRIVNDASEKTGLPRVTNRWIGGTLTNWKAIKSRIDRLLEMKEKTEAGEYAEKFTKKEQLLLSREIDALEHNFGGISTLENLPDALFVVDPAYENIAVKEANDMDIPVVALANTDCNLDEIQYPIPANDGTVKSIQFVVDAIASAYNEGKTSKRVKTS